LLISDNHRAKKSLDLTGQNKRSALLDFRRKYPSESLFSKQHASPFLFSPGLYLLSDQKFFYDDEVYNNSAFYISRVCCGTGFSN